MKILYVASAFLPESTGGTELHAYHLARELAKSHEVMVFSRGGNADRDDYVIDRFEHGGVPVARINYMFRDAASFEWIYLNRHIDEAFRRVMHEFSPDLVHIHHLTCLSTGIIDVVKDAGIPLVMTLHDFWMVCPRGQRIDANLEICETVDRIKCETCLAGIWPHWFDQAKRPLFERLVGGGAAAASVALRRWDEHVQRVLSRVDLLLSPTEFHRERMLEFPLPADRFESLWHGLDHVRLGGTRHPDAPVKRIGFIGTVIPSKGVHVLIDAFRRLSDADLSLDIHGEAPNFHGDATYRERLLAAAGDDSRIHFHGRYENDALPQILASIDVVVVPSLWWETFCLTIHEGLLSGAIVVAADHGAMRESVSEGRDGLLFRPNDAEDLARVLRRLLLEPDLRIRLRNKAAAVKTIETNARQMTERYAEVLDRCGRSRGLAFAAQPVPAAPLVKDVEAGNSPKVTVFIPTWNGEEFLDEVLRLIFAQKTSFVFEVLIIDSGSRDRTLEILARHPVRLITIPNWEFNHGLTRNRAVREAKGEIVVLLTQDAIPYNDVWLESLVSNFDDPRVAGAFCHQIPRENCNPFQRDRLAGWTYGEGTPEVKCMTSRIDYEALTPMEKYRLIAFDDVASSVRKSVMASIPFERRQFGEDVAWGKCAILAGHKLVMDPRAVVVHSHDKSSWYEFKRVYLDHQNLNDLVGMHLVPRFTDALRFTVSGTRHLAQVISRAQLSLLQKLKWWLRTPLYSLGQNMGQYLGARSSIAKKRGFWGFLDRRLKKGV